MRLQFDSEVDYYEVLQVHPKAHPEIIKRAYRTLAAQLHAHPDLGGSHQQMVLINRAYEVLSSEELRAEYDRWRASHAHAPAGKPASQPAATARPPSPPPPPGPSPAAGAISAVCLKCGRRNRLPQEIGLFRARCGACGERLIPAPAGAPPSSAEAEDHRATRGRHAAAHRLPQALYNELCREGQLRVQLQRVARGIRLVCRRCQRPWWAPMTGRPPRRCPGCGSEEWLTFRLFKCAHCGQEFETSNLRGWPYLLYRACPGCGARDWNRGIERSPLRWLTRLLFKARADRSFGRE